MMQVLKSARVFALLAAMLAALVLAVSAMAAGPSDSTISISPTATLVPTTGIDVQVTYTCAPHQFVPGAEYLQVNVDQPQTGNDGMGFATATCDGKAHKATITVTGSFTVGDANAFAYVNGFVGAVTNREIHIR
jgi:hypothetical protein